MSSNPCSAASIGVLKGCLGGIALALVFLGISGGTYLIMSAVNAPSSVTLLISIGSGPIIGTFLLTLYSLRLTAKMRQSFQKPASNDETTIRDGS